MTLCKHRLVWATFSSIDSVFSNFDTKSWQRIYIVMDIVRNRFHPPPPTKLATEENIFDDSWNTSHTSVGWIQVPCWITQSDMVWTTGQTLIRGTVLTGVRNVVFKFPTCRIIWQDLACRILQCDIISHQLPLSVGNFRPTLSLHCHPFHPAGYLLSI